MYITSNYIIEAQTAAATQDVLNILNNNGEQLGLTDDIETVTIEGGISHLLATKDGTFMVTVTFDTPATAPVITIAPVTDMEDMADGSENTEAYQLIVALLSTLA